MHNVDAEQDFNDDLCAMDDVVYLQRFGESTHPTPQNRSHSQLKSDSRTLIEGRDYAWHRNESGCWEIGYSVCDWGSFPCSCCCTGNGSMYYACFCKEFGVGEACEVGTPEIGRAAGLVEWARGRAKELLLEEEGERVVVEEETEWVMLEDSDDGWSVVSEE
jgi:hypothetical protein